MGFAGAEVGEDLDHHRDHNVHPAGADEGEGAVEIEDGDARIRRGGSGVDGFYHLLFGKRNLQRGLAGEHATGVVAAEGTFTIL